MSCSSSDDSTDDTTSVSVTVDDSTARQLGLGIHKSNFKEITEHCGHDGSVNRRCFRMY